MALGDSLDAEPAEAQEGQTTCVRRFQVDLSRSCRGVRTAGVSTNRREKNAAQTQDFRDALSQRFQTVAKQEKKDAVAEAVRLAARIPTNQREHRAATQRRTGATGQPLQSRTPAGLSNPPWVPPQKNRQAPR